MRLTVGPLPPTVYWRRRALVLGVLVLVGFLVAYYITGGTHPEPTGPLGNQSLATTTTQAQTTTQPPTQTATQTATVGPTVTGTPTGTGTGGGVSPETSTVPAPPVGGPCTDTEIQLTATTSKADVVVGQGATFTLIVKNVSQRTCNRNIGSIPQELQLRLGDTVVWSSDSCSGAYLYDYDQVFTPGYSRSFPIDWNGYRNQGGSAMQPCLAIQANLPAPGQYQLVARLGGLFSQPVPLTIHSGA
jgi:hypothetical protein